MQPLNDQVYVLDGLQDDLEGKQSSTDRYSHRTAYPLIRDVPELSCQIIAIGRAPFAVPDGVRTGYDYFVGPAIVAVETGDADEGEGSVAPFGGLGQLTVTGDRVLGVLMADQKIAGMLGRGQLSLNQAMLGFAAPRRDLKVSSSGSQGVFKKRPSSISLEGPWWDCHFSLEVSRLHVRDFGEPRFQGGQENALVESLGRG